MLSEDRDEAIRNWLVKALYKGEWNTPYQYGYILTIDNAQVLATSSGFVAYYSWTIPVLTDQIVYRDEAIQIVDFGYGTSLETAKAWTGVTSAFANLLYRFSRVAPISIQTAEFVESVERIHNHVPHEFQAGTKVRLSFQKSQLVVESTNDASFSQLLTSNSLSPAYPFDITFQSGLLLDALSVFRDDDVITLKGIQDTRIMSLGSEHDRLAIVMGLAEKKSEETKMRLEGKVALVTGAARGIGKGLAKRFALEGAKVGVVDLREAECQMVVEEIASVGGEAIALGADISDEAQANRAAARLRERFGVCNVLVNNAAVMPAGAVHETSLADFDRCIAVNLRGTFLMCRAVIPGMLEIGKGSIIHMSSVTGILGLPGLAAYSTTKAGLSGLARAMSTDYARRGIRVNAVAPGTIDSPMLHDFLAAQQNPEPLRQQFDDMHPIGRVGQIDEVASVFVFLASDEASFVTGSTYTVDGGLSVKGEQPQD